MFVAGFRITFWQYSSYTPCMLWRVYETGLSSPCASPLLEVSRLASSCTTLCRYLFYFVRKQMVGQIDSTRSIYVLLRFCYCGIHTMLRLSEWLHPMIHLGGVGGEAKPPAPLILEVCTRDRCRLFVLSLLEIRRRHGQGSRGGYLFRERKRRKSQASSCHGRHNRHTITPPPPVAGSLWLSPPLSNTVSSSCVPSLCRAQYNDLQPSSKLTTRTMKVTTTTTTTTASTAMVEKVRVLIALLI